MRKQFDQDIPGQKLAVSDHLRDANPTAFVHLYDWYRATYSDSKTKNLTQFAPADAQEELDNFALDVMQEARKSLEIHRRVIQALTEAQTPSSYQRRLQSKSIESLSIATDLPMINP